MKKIKEYKIAVGGSIPELVAEVRTYSEQGWQPFGDPSSMVTPTEFFIMQAVVKYEE